MSWQASLQLLIYFLFKGQVTCDNLERSRWKCLCKIICDFAEITSWLCGRTPQYAPTLASWPIDLKSGVQVMCDVGYLCANFSLPRPLPSRLRPDVRDRQTSDAHHRLMPPPYGGGSIITKKYWAFESDNSLIRITVKIVNILFTVPKKSFRYSLLSLSTAVVVASETFGKSKFHCCDFVVNLVTSCCIQPV